MYRKFKDSRYRQRVKDWIRKLRKQDATAEHEQAFRDVRKGELNLKRKSQ